MIFFNPFKTRRTVAELIEDLRPVAEAYGLPEAYISYDFMRDMATDRPEWVFVKYPVLGESLRERNPEFRQELRERFEGQVVPFAIQDNFQNLAFAREHDIPLFDSLPSDPGISGDEGMLRDVCRSLAETFEDIEDAVRPIVDSGADVFGHDLDGTVRMRLSSDFSCIYSGCLYLERYHRDRFSDDSLAFIRNMRWICSCGHGTSGDAMLFLHAAADGIPLLRDPMMAGLRDILNADPCPERSGAFRRFLRPFRRDSEPSLSTTTALRTLI